MARTIDLIIWHNMKSFLSNAVFILLVRIFLGGLFISASLDKFSDTSAFTTSIINYKVIGLELSSIVATVLPSLELLCGLCLILGLYPRASALIITVLLFAFTVLIASALLRGLDISCGCFSQDPSVNKIGYTKIFENLVMMILGIYLIFVRNYGLTLFNFSLKDSKITA